MRQLQCRNQKFGIFISSTLAFINYFWNLSKIKYPVTLALPFHNFFSVKFLLKMYSKTDIQRVEFTQKMYFITIRDVFNNILGQLLPWQWTFHNLKIIFKIFDKKNLPCFCFCCLKKFAEQTLFKSIPKNMVL